MAIKLLALQKKNVYSQVRGLGKGLAGSNKNIFSALASINDL
jgi:hypothetical protein